MSNLRKIRILVKIFENLDFWEDFRNTSNLLKIVRNIDFWQNWRKFQIGHNFRKTSILFEISRFWSKFPKMSIFVKVSKILNWCQTFEKSGFWWKSKNSDFGQNWWKFQVSSKSSKNLNFIRSISILVQISENLDFGENFWKLLVEVKIFEISRFGPKI